MRNTRMMFGRYGANLKWIAVVFVLVVAFGPMAVAQSSKVLTLEEAVDFALKNYPAVRASLAYDRQQHHGTAPSAIRHCSHYRCRDTLAVESERMGKHGGTPVLLGTLRFWIPRGKGGRGACCSESC